MFGLLEGGRGLFAAIISFAASWMILNAYTRPGDKILIQPPVYNTFSVVIQGAGRFVENNNLILKDGHYEIDFEDLDIMEKGEPVPRKADLRAFVLSGKETKVWKSGLTRFSRNPDSFIVNSSQGGGFKDTWVLSQ